MKGDFTRTTFDPSKHYSRVFEQQGRVQVDSDFNEMNDIHRYFARRLAADLIGPHGGIGDAFQIDAAKDKDNRDVLRDFDIGAGHYYVNGTLCENAEPVLFSKQNGSPLGLDNPENGKKYVAYLDVWERHVTAYEDEDEEKIGIREVALRGPDTATRAQIVWQVKCKVADDKVINALSVNDPAKAFAAFLEFIEVGTLGTGRLRARALRPNDDDEPCLISPESRYRGAENQLYRVEIHHGGIASPSEEAQKGKVDPAKVATFKWSRENGSIMFPIVQLEGKVITLRDLGRDSRFGLHVDDWVEIVDDDYVLQNRAEQLLQIKEIDRDNLRVTLNKAPASPVGSDETRHPLLRRWDQRSDAITVVETSGDEDFNWITLEDGVQIQFPGAAPSAGGGRVPEAATYHTGDYWLIPARVATGDVEWPGPTGNPRPRHPFGVEHSFAPLAVISIDGGGKVSPSKDLRAIIKQLWLS
jgi:hypothetical protein